MSNPAMSPAANLDDQSQPSKNGSRVFDTASNFDFSGKGSRRVTHPVKKVRKKLLSEKKKVAHLDCLNPTKSNSSHFANAEGLDGSSSSYQNGGFVFGASKPCNGYVGLVFGASKSGNDNVGFVFGANKSSPGVNFTIGSPGLPFGVANIHLMSNSYPKTENFVFRAATGGLSLGLSNGNAGFVQSSSTNNLNDLRDDDAVTRGSIFASSSGDSNRAPCASKNSGNLGFVFSANKSSTIHSSSTNNLNAVPDADSVARGSVFTTSSGDSSCVSGACKSNGNVSFVFSSNNSRTSPTVQSSTSNANDVLGANAIARGSIFKYNSGDSSCLFNTCKIDSSSKVGQMGSGGAFGPSSRVDKLNKFDNFTFVFRAKSDELPSGLKLGQEGLDDSSAVHLGGNDGESSNGGVFFGDKVSKTSNNSNPERTGDCKETKVHAGVVSQKDASNSSMFGTGWGHGDRRDHSSFVFGDKGNAPTSEIESGRTGSSCCGGTTQFSSKDENGNGFVFRGNVREKFSSNAPSGPADGKNQLNGETTGTNNVKFPNDNINFKFVSASGCNSGSAFYKVPLSKLVDEMKSLRLDDCSGTSDPHKLTKLETRTHFHTSGVNTTRNVGQVSCFSTKSDGTASRNQQKHPNAESSVVGGCQAEEVDIASDETCSKVDDIIKAARGVNLSCPSTNVIREDDQPLNSGVSKSPRDQQKKDSGPYKTSSNTFDPVQQRSCGCEEFPTTEVENKENLSFASVPSEIKVSAGEFNNSNSNKPSSNKINPLAELSENLGFVFNSETSKEKTLKKTRRKLRPRIRPKNFAQMKNMPTDSHSSNYSESPGHNSPMNFSPYQETTDVAPDSASASVAAESKEGAFSAGTERSGTSSRGGKSAGQDNVNSKEHCGNNFKAGPSSSDLDGLSAVRRQYSRKYKLKVGDGSKGKTTLQNQDLLSSLPFSSPVPNPSHNVKSQIQCGIMTNTNSEVGGEDNYQDPTDHWRIRGNQAYKAGNLSEAEELYTKGIHSAVDNRDSSSTIEPLLLCYSNRAATRMALGRLREALEDCRSAAALDPNFIKVKLRAANCHLVLGDFKAAMQWYGNCLEPANQVCLDRRLTIEAADSLRKAQKVAENMCQAVELLKQKTSDAANSSLSLIVEALSVSCYSERLLQMKGEALFLLRKYNEVIELCEQTLHIAERNFSAGYLESLESAECISSPTLWRWHLMAKSYFHLGRLDVALDLIEKREQLLSSADRSMNEESPASLAVTIRDMLRRKKAGNEAFKEGKHMDALENYTAALSIGVECRPFAAICFCNLAAAHQALGQIVDAIADCNLAIALDGNYLKAVSRRATLYEMIRDYKSACADLQKLLVLLENKSQEKAQQPRVQDASNGEKDLKQARRRLSLVEDKMRKEISLDLYLILGTKPSDTESDIKKAYRKAALKHHPDKAGQFLARNENGDDGRLWKDIGKKIHEDADKLFKMIGEAYGMLSDPDKRSQYNHEEELRNRPRESNMNATSYARSPDFHRSPRRQSDFYSYPFDRRRNG